MDPNDIKDSIMDPEDVTDQFDPQDIASNKVMAVLACIPILFWLPLAAAPNSGFAKHYANQGLILLLLWVVIAVVVNILSAILGIIPVLGGILAAIIGLLCGLVQFAAFLLLFVSALSGKAKVIPIIGNMLHPFN